MSACKRYSGKYMDEMCGKDEPLIRIPAKITLHRVITTRTYLARLNVVLIIKLQIIFKDIEKGGQL